MYCIIILGKCFLLESLREIFIRKVVAALFDIGGPVACSKSLTSVTRLNCFCGNFSALKFCFPFCSGELEALGQDGSGHFSGDLRRRRQREHGRV